MVFPPSYQNKRVEQIDNRVRNWVGRARLLDSPFSNYDTDFVHSGRIFFIVCRIPDIQPVKRHLISIYIEQAWKKKNRIHIYFCSILLLLIIISLFVGDSAAYIPRAIFGYLFILACIYTGRGICRRWFLAKRWLGLIEVVIVAIVGYDVIGLIGYIYLFDEGISINHALESAINTGLFVVVLLFGGFFISVTRSAIREKMNGLILAEQRKASELSLLQSQVSPHFLFNTLNNMYSLSINRPERMPGLLLKLSALLRYSVYEAGQPWVGLEEELSYIRNYIELEGIRSSDRLLLALTIDTPSVPAKIAPMILIVFVENAFKHARNTLEQKIEIAIDLQLEKDYILFNVVNSCTEENPADMGGIRHSGFGVDNVVKRMELLYPGEYTLKRERVGDYYKVELRLKVK